MFSDSRWQGSAGSSGGGGGGQPQMIKFTPRHPHTHSCATGWSGPLGTFLSIPVQASGMLCLLSIFFFLSLMPSLLI